MATTAQYTAAAREFVAAFVQTDRQWDTSTLASYLPKGRALRSDAAYAGPGTIASIAAFMRSESVAQ